MKKILLAIMIAATLWFIMFSSWTSPYISFWPAMTCSACILSIMAFCLGRPGIARVSWSEVFSGVGIAVLLWIVFWTGDKVSSFLFPFARPQVNLIYGMGEGISTFPLSLLLLCIIGPSEEFFWRGFIQQKFTQRYNANTAFILTTLVYTAVHIPSMNFMLVMAAMLCGITWGGLYRFFPQHFPAIVLSHALWDTAAFVWFPF